MNYFVVLNGGHLARIADLVVGTFLNLLGRIPRIRFRIPAASQMGVARSVATAAALTFH